MLSVGVPLALARISEDSAVGPFGPLEVAPAQLHELYPTEIEGRSMCVRAKEYVALDRFLLGFDGDAGADVFVHVNERKCRPMRGDCCDNSPAFADP